MTTTSYLRKILHQKQVENVAPLFSLSNTNGGLVLTSFCNNEPLLFFLYQSQSRLDMYNGDGFVSLTNASATLSGYNTATAALHTSNPIETITWSGSSPSIGTLSNRAVVRDLSGYYITGQMSVGGVNAAQSGSALLIGQTNLGGSGSGTISVQGLSSTPSSTVPWQIFTPTIYLYDGTNFSSYSFISNSWTSLTTTGLTAATHGKLVTTPSWDGNAFRNYYTGSPDATYSSTTITFSGASWTTNQWANYQIRVLSGTGNGQVRTIVSNTSNTLTLSSALLAAVGTGSSIAIQPNDDYVYYVPVLTSSVFRYSISANTWTTLTPAASRNAAPASGCSALWVSDCTDTRWTNTNAIINGDRIYCYRGNSSTAIDYYDISANTWVVVSNNANREAISAGSNHFYYKNKVYSLVPCESGDRYQKIISFDVARGIQSAEFSSKENLYGMISVFSGNSFAPLIYKDGSTELLYAYYFSPQTLWLKRVLLF